MDRFFEKISFEQFKKDVKNDKNLYESYNIPTRATKNSAGYDFTCVEGFTIKSGEIKKIPTGIKAKMLPDEMLQLYVRSGLGFKYNIRLTNQVGIIDMDYYNNKDNEGHIWYSIQNHGNKDMTFKKGDKIVQGIFTKYLLTSNDKLNNNERISGFGSTNKEE